MQRLSDATVKTITYLVQAFSICITKSDMEILTGHLTWLNDQVLIITSNSYLVVHDIKCIDNQLLYCIRVQQEAGEHSNSHIHFYSKHSKDGFQGVKMCTNKVHRYPCCFLHMMILPLAVLSPIIHQANGSLCTVYLYYITFTQ